jgi:hypothetical protein
VALVQRPRFTVGSLVSGAAGGVVAAAASTALLAALHAVRQGSAWVPLNAIGAWAVRWLQPAAPDAFTHVYGDATAGGLAVALVTGAAVGALFASLLERLPRDHPVGWGLLAGISLWAFTWWRALPALDPAFVAHVEREAWLASCVLFGALLGVWIHGDRRVRAMEESPWMASG